MVDVARPQAQRQGGGPNRGPFWAVLAAVVAVAALVGGVLVLVVDGGEQPEQPPAEGGVVFEDDFEGEISDDQWLVADYSVDVNDEKAYYTPDSVTTRDGNLVITSERREIEGQEFASGLLSTAGRFSFTYGTVEWRARAPKGKGVWPALWLNGQDCAQTFQNASQRCPTWPQRGSDEIDVLEIAGSEPHKLHMTQHYNPHGEEHDIPNEFEWEGPDLSEDFHTYALEWTPDALVWYVDGVERARATEPIPDTPKFLIMNTAIGGHFDGDPDEHTEFPVEFEIDWVRVTEHE